MRSRFIAAIAVFAAATATIVAQTKPSPTPLVVYKTATCGCCAKWVEHMEANGFNARVVNVDDTSGERAKAGVPARLGSCHTAIAGGYAIEGHVPAADVKRVLREKPAIAGLAAPGMPAGSPGMDVPNSPPFDVIAFDKNGNTRVYATHR
jgi:hypothetical protein